MSDERTAPRTRRRYSLLWPNYRFGWRGAVVPTGLVIALQLWLSATGKPDAASPIAVARAFGEAVADGSLRMLTVQTLTSVLLGLAIGGAIGLMLGTLLGLFRTLDRLTNVTIEALRPIPSAAFIPIMMLIFGFGYRMEATMVAIGALFPMLIYTRSAVAGTEPRLLELSRALGLSTTARIIKIVLPAALPRIFVGFRLAAGMAMVVGVTVEIAVNPQGLGSGIMIAEQTLQSPLMYALLVWVAVLGWLLNASLLYAQARAFGPPGGRQ